MPNIEVKAICRDIELARTIADRVKTDSLGQLHQIDTYYETKRGRLKLREINDEKAQLIPYFKEYSYGPMKSLYSLLDVHDKENLKNILSNILGEICVIDKMRTVFLVNNIRVHLDYVKGLGTFIEFEAVYKEDTTDAKEREVHNVNELMKVFNIQENDLLDKSYIDYFINKDLSLLSENVSCLYHFQNENHLIVELKKLNIEKTLSAEKRFFWLYYNKQKKTIDKLIFINMSEDQKYAYREFEGATLKFNLDTCVTNLSDSKLQRVHGMFLDQETRKSLLNYLSEI